MKEQEKREMISPLKLKADVVRAERARLFPVLSESSKEGRAASILLACLSIVPEFADCILKPLGRPIGSRSTVYCLTEIEFEDKKQSRPDGLIGVVTGSSVWKALLEFKVGGNLEKEQVEKYLTLARELNMDSLITISNDIVPDPSYSPIEIDKRIVGKLSLFHVSWMKIFTLAQLLLSTDAIKDKDHSIIIEEFLRFLLDKSTGIKGYTQMPIGWKDLIQNARTGVAFQRRGELENSISSGWLQQEEELSFILSKKTGAYCEVKRSNKEKKNGIEIRTKHLDNLCSEKTLETELIVPNASSSLDISVKLESRSIRISMKWDAPKDKKQAKACITWLTRQIPNEVEDVSITSHWLGRSSSIKGSIEEVKNDPNKITKDQSSQLPVALEISRDVELGAKFSSRKGIIDSLETEVPKFYQEIGENIVAWVAKPAKTKQASIATEISDNATYTNNP